MLQKAGLQFLIILFIVSTLAGFSCQENSRLNGQITKVKDGDSFVMMLKGKSVEVRLQGIDCPEKGQPFSVAAKNFTAEMVKGKKVQLEMLGTDQYERILGVVMLDDGIILNEALLKAGFAWHYKKHNSSTRYADLERSARANKLGLWIDPDPVPPWEFRSNKRKKY